MYSLMQNRTLWLSICARIYALFAGPQTLALHLRGAAIFGAQDFDLLVRDLGQLCRVRDFLEAVAAHATPPAHGEGRGCVAFKMLPRLLALDLEQSIPGHRSTPLWRGHQAAPREINPAFNGDSRKFIKHVRIMFPAVFAAAQNSRKLCKTQESCANDLSPGHEKP